jgi:hypothetical protein
MNVKIETSINLDPSSPAGAKNLQLLLSSAGIRSQIDFLRLNKSTKQWAVDLYLERAEYWGDELSLLKHDLDNLVLTVDKKPHPLKDKYKITIS